MTDPDTITLTDYAVRNAVPPEAWEGTYIHLKLLLKREPTNLEILEYWYQWDDRLFQKPRRIK